MVALGGLLFAMVVLITLAAPWLATHDPQEIDPIARLRPPSAEHLLGTDALGRDVWSRTIFGGRISLLVGLVVGLLASAIGLADRSPQRLQPPCRRRGDAGDGWPDVDPRHPAGDRADVGHAGQHPDRHLRHHGGGDPPRGAAGAQRGADACASRPMWKPRSSPAPAPAASCSKHILPNTLAPLIVQTTYICAAAMLVESILSFLGAGTPPEVPSWGNIMAEGRTFFQIAPWLILSPGLLLGATVLAINLVGDGLRGMLDPRIARRM